MRDQLLGRDGELALADAVVKQVIDGESVVLQISGEPGIGKSSLVNAIAQSVSDLGVRVIRGNGSKAEMDFPYGLFINLFNGVFTEDRVTDNLNDFEIADLAQVLPGLRQRQADGEVTQPNPVLICHSFRKALSAYASGARALILIIDDIQWADPSTVAAIDFLSRHLVETPTLIVTASRPGLELVEIGGDDGASLMPVVRVELRPISQIGGEPPCCRGTSRCPRLDLGGGRRKPVLPDRARCRVLAGGE